MKKSLKLLTVLSIFTTFQATASTPLNWCITELIEVKDSIRKIDKNIIENVDGYQDPDLIKSVQECESLLAEAEGTLIQVCQDREKLKGLTNGSTIFINKKYHDICSGISVKTVIVNEIERQENKDAFDLQNKREGIILNQSTQASSR